MNTASSNLQHFLSMHFAVFFFLQFKWMSVFRTGSAPKRRHVGKLILQLSKISNTESKKDCYKACKEFPNTKALSVIIDTAASIDYSPPSVIFQDSGKML
jgi:hypothetical protein